MKKIIYTLFVCLLSFQSMAQIDLGQLLEGGEADANKLLESYLEPAFVGFGYGINSGWYNTGKPHKLLGFDLTVNGTMAYVPASAEYFTINPLDYDNLNIRPSDDGTATDVFPTLMGPNLGADQIPYLVFNEGTDNEVALSGPTGLGLKETKLGRNVVPTGMAQIGIGLVKNTELKIRFTPAITVGDPGEEVTTKLFGIGVLHDVKQWIPGIKNLPFDLSAFVGYTKLTTDFQIDKDAPDQIGEFQVSGTSFQGIISKKLAILTVYGGLGIASTRTTYKMLGTYETEVGTFTDPINFDFNSGGATARIGARVKLLILTFHAEYTAQKYNTLTAGVGISVR